MYHDINFGKTPLNNNRVFDETNFIHPTDKLLIKNINDLHSEISCLLNKYDACFFNCIKKKYAKQLKRKYYDFVELEKNILDLIKKGGLNSVRELYFHDAINNISITNFELYDELSLRYII